MCMTYVGRVLQLYTKKTGEREAPLRGSLAFAPAARGLVKMRVGFPIVMAFMVKIT